MSDIELRDNDRVVVQGAMTFDTVPHLWERSEAWFRRTDSPSTVDLAGVQHSDSAGLALLVGWLRLAAANKRRLQFVNLPEQVRSLIRVSDLEQVLNPRGSA